MFDDACSMKKYYTSLVLEDTAANKTYKFSGTSFPWEPLVIKGNSFIFKVDNTENLGPKDFYGWKFTVNGLDSLPDESIKVVQTRHPQRGDTKIKGEIDFPNCKGMVLNFDKECSSRKFYDKLIITPAMETKTSCSNKMVTAGRPSLSSFHQAQSNTVGEQLGKCTVNTMVSNLPHHRLPKKYIDNKIGINK